MAAKGLPCFLLVLVTSNFVICAIVEFLWNTSILQEFLTAYWLVFLTEFELYNDSFQFLVQLRSEDILLRGLKWSKLLDPEKKGQWWLSGEILPTMDNVEEVATSISKEVLEAQKLVQLAAAQRMNTDLRRAIFCIIMSGEDYMDAFEKILRLDLSGKQVLFPDLLCL